MKKNIPPDSKILAGSIELQAYQSYNECQWMKKDACQWSSSYSQLQDIFFFYCLDPLGKSLNKAYKLSDEVSSLSLDNLLNNSFCAYM